MGRVKVKTPKAKSKATPKRTPPPPACEDNEGGEDSDETAVVRNTQAPEAREGAGGGGAGKGVLALSTPPLSGASHSTAEVGSIPPSPAQPPGSTANPAGSAGKTPGRSEPLAVHFCDDDQLTPECGAAVAGKPSAKRPLPAPPSASISPAKRARYGQSQASFEESCPAIVTALGPPAMSDRFATMEDSVALFPCGDDGDDDLDAEPLCPLPGLASTLPVSDLTDPPDSPFCTSTDTHPVPVQKGADDAEMCSGNQPEKLPSGKPSGGESVGPALRKGQGEVEEDGAVEGGAPLCPRRGSAERGQGGGVLAEPAAAASAVRRIKLKSPAAKSGLGPDEAAEAGDLPGEPGGGGGSAGFFSTGSGKRVEVSKEALQKAQDKLGGGGAAPGNAGSADTTMGPAGFFSTGSGKRVEVSRDALRKAKDKLGGSGSWAAAPAVAEEGNGHGSPAAGGGSAAAPQGGFFSTGSGKRVEVSRDALRKAQDKLGNVAEPEDSSDTSMMGGGFFSTGSGKRVEVSKDALRKAQDKLGNVAEPEGSGDTSMMGGGFFSTGSGKRVEVSKEALQKAQDKLGNSGATSGNADSADATMGPAGFFSTGSGKRVEVSKDALRKAQEKLGNVAEPEDSGDTSMMGGGFFSTGSGKRVEVSKEALQKAQDKLGKASVEAGESPDTTTASAGSAGFFSTGSGRKVEVSKDALNKANARLQGWDSSSEPNGDANHHQASPAAGPPVLPPRPATATAASPAAPRRPLHKAAPSSVSRLGTMMPGRRGGVRRPFKAPRTVPTPGKAGGGSSNSAASPPPPRSPVPVDSPQGLLPPPPQQQQHHHQQKPPPKRGVGRLLLPSTFPEKVPSVSLGEAVPRGGPNDDPIAFPFSGDEVVFHLSEVGVLHDGLRGTAELLAQAGSPAASLRSVGPFQFYAAMKQLGADLGFCTLDWVMNHIRFVAIKLSELDQLYDPPARLPRHLCPDIMLVHLVYRYNTEYAGGKRSILHRLYNRDVSLIGRCVGLKVVNIFFGTGNPASPVYLELSDGWYSMVSKLDRPLSERVTIGSIMLGTKLLTHSPAALLENATEPIPGMACSFPQQENGAPPAPPTPALAIGFNSTRPLLNMRSAPLGIYPAKYIPHVRLSCVLPDGGVAPCIPVVVQRVYPESFVETVEEKGDKRNYISRTEIAESAAQDSHQRKCEEAGARIHEEMEKEMEDVVARIAKERGEGGGGGDHGEGLSEAGRAECEREARSLREEKVAEDPVLSVRRKVQLRREILVSDPQTKLVKGTVRLYDPSEEMTSQFIEGQVVYLYSFAPPAHAPPRGIASPIPLCNSSRNRSNVLLYDPTKPGNASSLFEASSLQKNGNATHELFAPRRATQGPDFLQLRDGERFDYAGVVMYIGPPSEYAMSHGGTAACNPIYLADSLNPQFVLTVTLITSPLKQVSLGSLQVGYLLGLTDLTFSGRQAVQVATGGSGGVASRERRSVTIGCAFADEKTGVHHRLDPRRRSTPVTAALLKAVEGAPLAELVAAAPSKKAQVAESFLSLVNLAAHAPRLSNGPMPQTPQPQQQAQVRLPPPALSTPQRANLATRSPQPIASMSSSPATRTLPHVPTPSTSNPNRTLYFSPVPSGPPQSWSPPQCASPANAPARQDVRASIPMEVTMHCFGHLCLPWVVDFDGTQVAIGDDPLYPVTPGKVAEVKGECVTSITCTFWDGWGERLQATVDLAALGQLLLPDSSINARASEVLKKLSVATSGNGMSEVRAAALNSKFGGRCWSPELAVRKILYLFGKGVVVSSADQVYPPACVPFSPAEWQDLVASLRSFASVFVKATVMQRGTGHVHVGGMPQSPMHRAHHHVARVIPISDAVTASSLY